VTTKKIGILVVAYNAATTLAAVLDRIPKDFRDSITSVMVGDDNGQDQPHLVAAGYQQLAPDLPLQITRHESNLGYGGNQKRGYRAYSVAALAQLPFERNSDGFDFDTQIIHQLIESGQRIAEIPISTYYGEEISHVNGLKYSKDVTSGVVRYLAHKMRLSTGELAFSSNADEQKQVDDSSHHILKGLLGTRSAVRVLDLGCSDGPFEIVLAADVLEHVQRPHQLLQQIHKVLAPEGSVHVRVPNLGHWYLRLRVALGRFDYDRRGHGQEVQDKGFSRLVNQIDRAAVSALSQLFGYQFLFELRADAAYDYSRGTE
jgi:hypothetical protein